MDLETFMKGEVFVNEIKSLEKTKKDISSAKKIGVNISIQDEKGTYIQGIDLPESICSYLKEHILVGLDADIHEYTLELEEL